jgi:hypothetical protein
MTNISSTSSNVVATSNESLENQDRLFTNVLERIRSYTGGVFPPSTQESLPEINPASCAAILTKNKHVNHSS